MGVDVVLLAALATDGVCEKGIVEPFDCGGGVSVTFSVDGVDIVFFGGCADGKGILGSFDCRDGVVAVFSEGGMRSFIRRGGVLAAFSEESPLDGGAQPT